jgi:hypothetical protein
MDGTIVAIDSGDGKAISIERFHDICDPDLKEESDAAT